MNALRSFLGSFHAGTHRANGAWYRMRWKYHAFVASGVVLAGRKCVFHVPVRSDGGGSVRLEDEVILGYPLAIKVGSGEILLQARGRDSTIRVGHGTSFSNNVSIVAQRQIVLGSQCLIGDSVTMLDSDFHELDPVTRTRSSGESQPVMIGNNVWLGSRVIVLKGVTIGDNSVVGSMSVVTRTIPPNCVAAGVPAKVLRHLDSDQPMGTRNRNAT